MEAEGEQPTEGGGVSEGDSTTDGQDEGDEEPIFCGSSADCAQTEVCFYGECLDTDTVYFTVQVTRFDPPDCLDGFGSAELIYYYYEDDVLMYSSSEALCPGSWPEEQMIYDSLKTFELEFWESDAFENDFVTSFCWLDDFDACGPVPKEVLHEGGYSGFDGEYYLEVTFTPTF